MLTGMAPQAVSLRERNKTRTREELIEVSQRLFRNQGYADTTLEQIANEGGVALKTLFRYFGSKLQLAVAPTMDGLDRFRTILDDSQSMSPGK